MPRRGVGGSGVELGWCVPIYYIGRTYSGWEPDIMAEPWYKDGLNFTCTQCGKCCTGEPGFVWVDRAEIAAIAEVLGEPVEEVTAIHTKKFGQGRSIREKADGDCVFFERGIGCTIYEVRPRQCRTWPFWESNLKSEAAWERTEAHCPGSGEGELIPVEEILRRVKVIRL